MHQRCRSLGAVTDDALAVLAGGRHFRLRAPTGPHPREDRVSMDFGFVLEDQDFVRVGPQRVLGPMKRRPFLVQKKAKMTFADRQSDLLLQVGVEPRRGPHREGVAERSRVGLHGLAQRPPIGRRDLGRTARWLDRSQPREAFGAIQAPHPIDRRRRTPQRRGNRRLRLPIATHQNEGGVAEDIRMIGREPQRIESVALTVGERTRACPDRILPGATVPQQGRSTEKCA